MEWRPIRQDGDDRPDCLTALRVAPSPHAPATWMPFPLALLTRVDGERMKRFEGRRSSGSDCMHSIRKLKCGYMTASRINMSKWLLFWSLQPLLGSSPQRAEWVCVPVGSFPAATSTVARGRLQLCIVERPRPLPVLIRRLELADMPARATSWCWQQRATQRVIGTAENLSLRANDGASVTPQRLITT